MKTQTNSKKQRQVGQYDKVVKENIEAVLPTLFEKVLDIHIVETEEIPDDLQLTIERKPDFLKKVKDSSGETYVLQVEFQVLEDAEMVNRMLEYYALIYRKYQFPLKQFVIFLGKETEKMGTEINHPRLSFSYILIKMIGIDYQYFISCEKPEEVLFAILSDFKGKKPEEVVKKIIKRLYETSQSQLSFQKSYQQLRILGNLRNLVPSIQSIMESVSTFYKLENDFVYLKGKEEGKKEVEEKVSKLQKAIVTELLLLNLLSVKQIAKIAQTKVAYVKKIEKEINTLKE